MENSFIIRDYGDDIFAISSNLWMTRQSPRGAIMQSYLIPGQKWVAVIDGPVPSMEGFREYIENYFGKPAMMINTHGHVDHTGENHQFATVYGNKQDLPLLLGDGITPTQEPYDVKKLPYDFINLEQGDMISLGDRELQVRTIPGHTPGSIMLYEKDNGILLSGDSVARRILYGLSGWTPLGEYLRCLKDTASLHCRKIYSIHDDFALPGNQPEKMIQYLIHHLETTKETWEMPMGSEKFLRILLGDNEEDIDYFDFVMPLSKKQEAIQDLKAFQL